MEKGWSEVLSTTLEYQAQMAVDILENNSIKAIVYQQPDSAYKIFGEYTVYVPEKFINQALELLKNLKS